MSNKIKLAIVGSRNFTDETLFETVLLRYLDELGNPDIECIISGGAQGADTLADRWATDNYVPIKVYPADWNAHGKAAGPIRNELIINAATHVLAFPSKNGKGTQDTISRAQKKSLPLKVYYVDNPE